MRGLAKRVAFPGSGRCSRVSQGYNPLMEIPGYEINREIGRGGMATAYLAEQRSLGRQVVLKILERKASETPETVERFLNEGRIIASLKHPHIITIFDIGQSGENVYISMEYVEGGDLKQRMQHKIFAPVEALDVIERIASGLGVAHENGIVHRDVKPGNILFRDDGTPLLSDFGIAKRLSGDPDLTSTGMFLGSPNYMAPEQSESGPLDGRADIYSLGVILYEMLTGERAYAADSVIDVILMHKKSPVPTLPAGLEQFQELLNLMMAKDRQERFRNADALLHFIAELRKSGVIKSKAAMTARPDIDVTGEHDSEDAAAGPVRAPAPPRATRPRSLKPLQLALIVLLAVCGLGWGVLLFVERDMARAERPQAAFAPTLDAVDTAAPAAPAAVDLRLKDVAPGDAADVAAALLWLGRHSLDEYRLTAPPRDNAFYYFSRLQQLVPGHQGAREGLDGIAVRFALLAEREIAAGDMDKARSYIALGQEIDPDNETLGALATLTQERQRGFWQALASLFR